MKNHEFHRIAILGAGALGQQIAHHAQKNSYQVVGFFDDFTTASEVQGIAVLGKFENVLECYNNGVFEALVVGIGYKHFIERQRIYEHFKNLGIPFATIIDSSAVVDPSASVGEGSVVLSGCIIDMQVNIKENVFLYSGVILAHDTQIGAHSFIAPGVVTAGCVEIGERCFLGVRSTYRNSISLCSDVIVGIGACVVKTIVEKGIYVGIPAKRINK